MDQPLTGKPASPAANGFNGENLALLLSPRNPWCRHFG